MIFLKYVFSVMQLELIGESMIEWTTVDLDFNCGEERLAYEVNTLTLKSICVEKEWMNFEFEIVYLNMACVVFI